MMDCLSFFFSPESSSVAVPLSHTCLFSMIYGSTMRQAAPCRHSAGDRERALRDRERALINRYLTPLLILYATFTEQQVSSR